MALLSNKKILLAKTESSYGVDPTPTGGANAMVVRNLKVVPLNAELVSRDLYAPHLGASDQLIAQKSVAMDFEVEIAGSGIPGVAPAWAPLIKACAFGETLTTSSITITRSSAVATVTETAHGRTIGSTVRIAGADQAEYNGDQVVASTPTSDTFTFAVSGSPVSPATGTITAGLAARYLPVSSAFSSVALDYNVDGVRHRALGARGTFEIGMNVKQIPIFKFSFQALYSAPVDAAAPEPDFSDFQIPRIVNTGNTTAFSLFSYAGYLEQMSLNMANDVQYRTLVGFEAVNIVQRKPSGTFVIEAPTITQKDFFAIAAAGTTGVMTITHGAVSGNKVTVSAPRVSLGNPGYQESQGVEMLSIPFTAAPSSGNDEVSIVAA